MSKLDRRIDTATDAGTSEPEKQKKWRNRLHMADGAKLWGENIWPTKEAAVAATATIHAWAREKIRSGVSPNSLKVRVAGGVLVRWIDIQDVEPAEWEE